jgi:hypothetical protein
MDYGTKITSGAHQYQQLLCGSIYNMNTRPLRVNLPAHDSQCMVIGNIEKREDLAHGEWSRELMQ